MTIGSNILVRVHGAGSNHRTNAESQTTDADNPRVGLHESVDKSALEHLIGCHADNTDTKTSVEEGLVEILALKLGHATLSRLPVEHDIDSDEGAAEDGAADDELPHRLLAAGCRIVVCIAALLLVTTGGASKSGENVAGAVLGPECCPRGKEGILLG